MYVAMVEAGEAGGFLDLVLTQIADFQMREKELRSKVMSALLYPAVLMFLATCVLIILLTFFIPQFQKIFSSLGGQLPLITRIIIGVSYVIRKYGLLVVGGIGFIVYMVRQWMASEKGAAGFGKG